VAGCWRRGAIGCCTAATQQGPPEFPLLMAAGRRRRPPSRLPQRAGGLLLRELRPLHPVPPPRCEDRGKLFEIRRGDARAMVPAGSSSALALLLACPRFGGNVSHPALRARGEADQDGQPRSGPLRATLNQVDSCRGFLGL